MREQLCWSHIQEYFSRLPSSKSSRTGRLISLEGGRAGALDAARLRGARPRRLCAQRHRLSCRAADRGKRRQSVVPFFMKGPPSATRIRCLTSCARPNPRQDGASFLESVASHLLLAGNAYIEAVGLEAGTGAGARALYAAAGPHEARARRRRLAARPTSTRSAGATVRFDAKRRRLPPILHLTFFNPLDDHYGFSPLEAAAMAVDTHNAAAIWNKALLDNAARPSRRVGL